MTAFMLDQGRPVYMERTGELDLAAMEASGVTLDDYVLYHCRVQNPDGLSRCRT
jgi:hypothetical protein